MFCEVNIVRDSILIWKLVEVRERTRVWKLRVAILVIRDFVVDYDCISDVL